MTKSNINKQPGLRKTLPLGCFLLLSAFCIAFISCESNSTKASIDSARGDSVPLSQLNEKKGYGRTTKRGDWVSQLKTLHARWHYSWGADLKDSEPAGIEFVPMIWSGNRADDSTMTRLKELAVRGKIHHLLGFNEPDQKKQSNMSVEEAIALWPKLMKVNVPLGSPACAHPTGTWMKTFMKEADSLGYRIDFITVHSYGGTNADNFINKLKKIHELYGRPVWITEFAVGDWEAKDGVNKYSPDQVLTFMKEVLPVLDTLSFVKRYAWFCANPTNIHTGCSALFEPDGSITPLGEYYAGH